MWPRRHKENAMHDENYLKQPSYYDIAGSGKNSHINVQNREMYERLGAKCNARRIGWRKIDGRK